MAVVILVLPAMFLLFDKVICKTSIGFAEEKKKKEKTASTVSDIRTD